MLYLILFSIVQKKRVKKRRGKKSCKKNCVEKVAKERRRIRLLYAQVLKVFISSCTTSLLSLLVWNFDWVWLQHLHPNHIPCLHQLWNFSLCVCVIHLYLAYLAVSTRQRTSSLDCYLSLQQLEFRLPLVYHPYQAPHKNHRVRFAWSCIRSVITTLYHHTDYFCDL